MENFKETLTLLDQLIEYAQREDNLNKQQVNKNSDKIGDSFMLFHLKLLKETIKKESNA